MLTFILALLADGMPIENGRFAGGPTTVLTLGEDQIRKLNGASRKLKLSEAQRAALTRSAGAAPRTLLVYDTRKGENDCCCDAENRALRFSADQLEVPHRYLSAPAPVADDWHGWPEAALLAIVAAGVFIAYHAGPR